MLFITAFSLGTVPQSWKTSLVMPILKRSDATDTANHRPIAVGEPLSRSSAGILVHPLVQYTEQQLLRHRRSFDRMSLSVFSGFKNIRLGKAR